MNLRLVAVFLLVFPSLVSVPGLADESLRLAKRAIGGKSFERGAWPWLVSLEATIVTKRLFGLFPLKKSYLYCGGALISDRWVLTAAHCFKENGEVTSRPWNWKARLATVTLQPNIAQRLLNVIGIVLDQNDLRLWELDIDRIVIHPNYNKASLYSDDIALVRLSKPVPNGKEFSLIQTIRLPDTEAENFPVVGQMCVTKGWGCTSTGGPAATKAKQIQVPIYSPWNCYVTYQKPMDKRLCAGYTGMGIGVCSGDSGGPLACRTGSHYTLAGIVSFTSKYNPADYPAVFTRVQDYIPWINKVIRTYTY